MENASGKDDALKRRAYVAEALVRELETGVIMCDSGYYIPKAGTFLTDDQAQRLLDDPRLMEKLKERLGQT